MKQKRHSSRDASSMAVGKQHHELRSNSIYDKTPILEAWKHLSMVPSARWVSANGRQEEETLKPPTFIAETRLGAFHGLMDYLPLRGARTPQPTWADPGPVLEVRCSLSILMGLAWRRCRRTFDGHNVFRQQR